jgi:hypothetical protein
MTDSSQCDEVHWIENDGSHKFGDCGAQRVMFSGSSQLFVEARGACNVSSSQLGYKAFADHGSSELDSVSSQMEERRRGLFFYSGIDEVRRWPGRAVVQMVG